MAEEETTTSDTSKTFSPQRRNISAEGDVNAGTYTRVHLRVRANTQLGEQVHISGSSFSMGQYNPNEATSLVTSPDAYPVWRTLKPLILPRGVPHHYMYALFSGGAFSRWEDIECDRTIVPEGLEMTVEEEFDASDETMILERSGTASGRNVLFQRVVDSDAASSSEDKEIVRSSSQHFPLNKVQGYKRFQSSNFKPSANAKLIIICYHLPIIIRKTDDDDEQKWQVTWNLDSIIAKSEGSIAESMKVEWIGCITHHAYPQLETLTQEDWRIIHAQLKELNCTAVEFDTETHEHYYQGYCKNVLWPMFHNVDILDLCNAVWEQKVMTQGTEEFATGKWWTAYKKVNQSIAEKVLTLMSETEDVTLWIHDYHLLLLASSLETVCKAAKRSSPAMVFFLHVPFPTSEIFRELSNGPELLQGVLCADVVGFHSFDHARHFLNACKRFLGLPYQSKRGGNLGVNFKGRNVIVTISHIGIEIEYLKRGLQQPLVQTYAKELQDKYPGKTLICGIDALQRLSGIPLKLLAFEKLIELCPVWKDKVVLVQRCIRGGNRFGDQNHCSQENRQLVERITKKHGPIIDYSECNSMGLTDRLALYSACDIMFHTAIRGGLNRKPLEYVFVREKAGVVLLSEFSACCCVMNGALRINPWNLIDNTTALDQALVMDEEERSGRRARDLAYITKKTAASWTRQVLSVLQEAREDLHEEYTDMEHSDLSHVLRIGDNTDFMQLDPTKLLQAYTGTKRRVFLLDYGGTIIARENMSMYMKKDFTAVSGRTPSPRMMTALANLSANPLNTVFVISGVNQVNLTSVLGHIQGLSLAAQNGALLSWARSMQHGEQHGELLSGPTPVVETLQDPMSCSTKTSPRRQWKASKPFNWEVIRVVADPILNAFRSRTNGSIVQHLDEGIAWNYRSTDPEWGLMQANQLQTDLQEVLKDFPVTMVRKKGLLEIVPEGLHKGNVARKILCSQSVLQNGHPDFVFCIGDDTTDESMFKAIYEYISERSEESVHGMAFAGVSGPFQSAEHNLQHVFTCTVGKKPSNAHLYVNEVEDVENLLSLLGDESRDETEAIRKDKEDATSSSSPMEDNLTNKE